MLMHKIYVPVETDMILETKISAMLCSAFGGFTKYNCEGAWSPYKNKLVLEPTKVYEIVTKHTDKTYIIELVVDMIMKNSEEEEVLYVTMDATPVTRKRTG